MRELVFLYNQLLDESHQQKLKLPLEFVSFAYVKNAVMYDANGRYVAIPKNALKKTNRGDKVFGALYILQNSEHFIRLLDASLVCSKTILGRNHKMDEHHRERIKVTPIQFKSIEDFLKLKYNEGVEISTIMYLGNPQNKFIATNVLNSIDNRVMCGFDINNFINLVIREKSDDE